MKKLFSPLGACIIFAAFTILIFSPYFFQGKVPFAGNLLVSFFQPWKSYTWENYPNGPANKPIGFDTLRIFYPFRSITTETLKSGKIPLWNPYTFSGNMYLAAYQTAVFFPLTPLFLLLPLLDGWSLMVILAPFLTALFTFYFLRSLHLSKKASLIGAFTFGFSGIIVAFTEEWYIASYSIIFLPLLFLSMQKLREKISLKYFVLFVISIMGSILSGWFQMTCYSLILGFFWTIFLLWQSKNKKWIWTVVIGFVLALGICSAYLLPNIQAFFYSARGTSDAKYVFDLYLLSINRLISYLVPDFWGNPATYTYFGGGFYQEKILYVGIVGLFFALYSLLRRKMISQVNTFFIFSWLISLSLGFSLPTSWILLYYLHIPLLSTLVPSRIIIITAFCLSVVAAFGIDAFFREENKKRIVTVGSIIFITLLAGWSFTLFYKWKNPLSTFATISFKSMVVPTGFVFLLFLLLFLYFLYKNRMQKLFFPLLLIVTIIPLYYFAHKYLYFSDRAFTFPQVAVFTKLQEIQGDDRFWSFGPGYIPTNVTAYYHLYSVEGYDSFYIQRYGELLDASANNGLLSKNPPRVDADMVSASTIQEIYNNPDRLKLLNLLGVKFLLGKPSKKDALFLTSNPSTPIQAIWTDGRYTIYQNNASYPRAFLVDAYSVVTNRQAIVSTLYSPRIDLSKMVILEKNPNKKLTTIPLQSVVHIALYTPEKIRISTSANKGSFLFLSDNFYPGWKAYIDGKTTEIYQADYTFRAIWVPLGQHTVIFAYQPEIFTAGIVCTVIGVLLFGVAGFTIYKKVTWKA